ncbi:ribosomal L37ae protein family-domain-containing protein [Crepidotus variabilis]|uniref:Ribosomal L37ae protein family-domain-containing protein n=1 Tax=Crepidotus variabilis TaxID=179855 RepID=A0A9P6EAA1_9AGAR|nr:ribosomal L37ae protein family-domain-containing protein [Crepidotus variabilis]
MPTVEIKVYALFPRVLAQNDKVGTSSSNWYWVRCLTVPVNELKNRSVTSKPFKWLRYAIGVVVGGEGILSLDNNSPPAVCDYDACFPDCSFSVYYHLPDKEKARMFPVDPQMSRTATTSSVHTSRKNHIREQVKKRMVTAVHLLAHSRGDLYISTFTQRRNRPGQPNDIVDHINDTRNGLLLNRFTQSQVGVNVAFLKTPNFAMDTDDRYTTHLFSGDCWHLGGPSMDSNAALRVPDKAADSWPPSFIFDAVYASAVLRHFGTPDLNNAVTSLWQHIWYPEGMMTSTQAKYQRQLGRKSSIHHNEESHEDPQHGVPKPDFYDMVMILPFIGIPPKRLNEAMANAEYTAEVANQARAKAKTKRTKKVGITGKYGTRYGASLRKQVKKMEISQHARYTCTFCGKDSVKRTAVGIWHCRACKKTIAGGAWSVSTTAAATVRSTVRRLREITEA